MLLAFAGFVTYRVTSPEQRQHCLAVALDALRQLKVAAKEPGPEHDAFCADLRSRTLHLLVIPAIIFVSAQVFLGMRFGATGMRDSAALVSWGASQGTLTTNLGWWRLVTSTFVYTSTLH